MEFIILETKQWNKADEYTLDNRIVLTAVTTKEPCKNHTATAGKYAKEYTTHRQIAREDGLHYLVHGHYFNSLKLAIEDFKERE